MMKFRNNIYTVPDYAETWQLCVCLQCLFARRVVHEKEKETTEREEEEEDKSSDEGLLLQAHHAMERMEEFVHKVRLRSSSLMHTFVSQLCKHRCALSLSLYVEAHMVRWNTRHQHTWPEPSAHSCFYMNTPQSTNAENIPAKPDAHLLAPAASHLNLVLRVCHMQRNRNRNWKPSFVTCAAMLSPINQLKFSLLFEPLLL